MATKPQQKGNWCYIPHLPILTPQNPGRKDLHPHLSSGHLGEMGKGRKIQDAILQTQRRNPRVGKKTSGSHQQERLYDLNCDLQLCGRQYVSTLDADLKMPQGELWRPLSFVVSLLCSFIMLSFFLDVFLFSLSNFTSDMLSMLQTCTYLWSNGWIGG